MSLPQMLLPKNTSGEEAVVRKSRGEIDTEGPLAGSKGCRGTTRGFPSACGTMIDVSECRIGLGLPCFPVILHRHCIGLNPCLLATWEQRQ